MKDTIKQIIESNLPEKKDVSEWKDGNLVQFESYSCYVNEGSSEEFSEEPDNFSMGVILGNKVFGDGMASDYELTKEDFKQGVWITGVDENGGHDVWEYCKATIIPNQALSQINTSLIADEVLKVVVEKIEKMIKIVNYQLGGFFIEEESYNKALDDVLRLLTNSSTLDGERSEHLSPNKENKNNDGRI